MTREPLLPRRARSPFRQRAMSAPVTAVVALSLLFTVSPGSFPAADAASTTIDPGFGLTQIDVDGVPVDVVAGEGGSVWVAVQDITDPGGAISLSRPDGSGYRLQTDVPNALASDDEGGIWATMPAAGRIQHIDRNGGHREWDVPTRGGGPVAAYDSGGYVYFVEKDARKLGRIDQVTGAITDYPIPGAVSPNAIDGITDPDGSHHTIWVTDPGAGRVWVLGTDGALIGSIDSLGAVGDIRLLASVGGLVEGIASTDTSLLYFKQTPGSTPVTELVGSRSALSGIEAYDGGIWMADSGSHSLVYFKDGSLTEYAAPELGGSLSGIAITEGRYVWTAGRGTVKLVRLDLQAKRTVTRIGGADRFEVSAQVSSKSFPHGAAKVFVASGEGFADALSVGPLAARANAPLLLTGRESLPPSVAAELTRLSPAQVVIVGGTNSVATGVEAAIRKSAPDAGVSRIDGPDRYAVSRALLTSSSAPASAPTLFVANGANFPDALSSGPAAAATATGVLLVNGAATSLSSVEMDLLRGFVSTGGTVEIVGGPNSVSVGIETQIRTIRAVERNGGADRFEVSYALNARVFGRPPQAFVASGGAFADALSGGVAAGVAHSPLYLSRPDCIPRSVAPGILTPSVGRVTLLGGPATLSTAVENLTICL